MEWVVEAVVRSGRAHSGMSAGRSDLRNGKGQGIVDLAHRATATVTWTTCLRSDAVK